MEAGEVFGPRLWVDEGNFNASGIALLSKRQRTGARYRCFVEFLGGRFDKTPELCRRWNGQRPMVSGTSILARHIALRWLRRCFLSACAGVGSYPSAFVEFDFHRLSQSMSPSSGGNRWTRGFR